MKKLLAALFFINILMLISCEDSSASVSQFRMNTACSITVYGNANKQICKQAFDLIGEIEKSISAADESSELSILVKKNPGNYYPVSKHLFNTLEISVSYARKTNGLFDPTIGPLVAVWNISGGSSKIPSPESINKACSRIDYKNIVMDKTNCSILLKQSGMKIDLGAVGKGYAADCVRDFLISKNVNRAIVDLGGNILMIGQKTPDTLWKIGIRDPFAVEAFEIAGIVKVANTSVVTSGTYERFFEKDGIRYHHLLNPFTGYPENNGVCGISVINQSSIDADALSTILFLMGPEKGLKWNETNGDCPVLYIMQNKKIIMNKKMQSIFELTDQNTFSVDIR